MMDRSAEHQVRTAGFLGVLMAVWLIVAPFAFRFTDIFGPAMGNSVLVGLGTGILSALLLVYPDRFHRLGWVIGGIGVWLIFSPFALGFAFTEVALWNALVAGAAVLALGIWSVLAVRVDFLLGVEK